MNIHHTLAPALYGIIFVAVYKLAAWYGFSGQPRIAGECITSYGGIATGEWGGFIQTGEETCGQAVLAFFKNHPATAIVHFSSQHFVVFLKEENYFIEIAPGLWRDQRQNSWKTSVTSNAKRAVLLC
jgi:hypothetical protein